jgi:hypothetical protein
MEDGLHILQRKGKLMEGNIHGHETPPAALAHLLHADPTKHDPHSKFQQHYIIM